PYDNPAPERWAQLVGGRVGAEAVKVLLMIVHGAGSDLPIATRQTVLEIPRRKPSPERLMEAMDLIEKDPKVAGVTEWTFAKEIAMLDHLIKKEPVAKVEVQAIQVGPAVFVTNPAEYFVQYGLDIKKGSPFPFTFPVELANDCVGYVPTEEAFGPNGGGYETRLTAYSNLATNAGRLIAEAGIRLSKELTPGKVPEPPKAPVFRTPWTYGNVPPEVR
ncbi:MAG TPA: hypothetical protein VK968_06130, partial [Roseimicrobium sp.]|nr:hypothetical protein [Roseimicrobium sp.]